MTELQHAQELRDELNAKIARFDIAGYLKSECEYFLKHLNSYKLQNLKSNMVLFKKYLLLLDDQMTKQVKYALAKSDMAHGRIDNIHFFFSRRGQRILGEKAKAIAAYTLIVQKIMQKIKAIFLFQATEFVHGSELRMKIVDFKRIHDMIVRRCKTVVG